MEKENKKNENDLDIPVNVPPIDYVVNGLGVPEFVKIAAGAGIGLAIGILIFMSKGTIYACLIFPIITGMIAFVIFRRDDHTENLIDKLGFVFEFKKTQKEYLYKYYNIYEDVEGEKVNGNKKRNA